jgi:hypothetical protein
VVVAARWKKVNRHSYSLRPRLRRYAAALSLFSTAINHKTSKAAPKSLQTFAKDTRKRKYGITS